MKLKLVVLKYANNFERIHIRREFGIRAKYSLEEISGEEFEDLFEFHANFSGDLILERNILNEQVTALYEKEGT